MQGHSSFYIAIQLIVAHGRNALSNPCNHPAYIAIHACVARLTAGKARLRAIRGKDLQANPGIAVQPTIGWTAIVNALDHLYRLACFAYAFLAASMPTRLDIRPRTRLVLIWKCWDYNPQVPHSADDGEFSPKLVKTKKCVGTVTTTFICWIAGNQKLAHTCLI